MLKLVGEIIDVNDVPEESKSSYERIQSEGYKVSFANPDAFNTDRGVNKVATAFI